MVFLPSHLLATLSTPGPREPWSPTWNSRPPAQLGLPARRQEASEGSGWIRRAWGRTSEVDEADLRLRGSPS